jgi:hypothetical protein
MNLVSPVAWYAIFWVTGAAIFLIAVRLVWVNPLLATLREILTELRRWA